MKIVILHRALILLLVCCCVAHARAVETADFVVAPNGSDQNPGSAEQPFATLARAQQAVRQFKRQHAPRDITVLVRGGTYVLTAPLEFGTEDSAAEGHRITYKAWPGESPEFSGGRVLTGWKIGAGNRWTLHIPEVAAGNWYFDQLFVNEHRQPRARHPNEGFVRVEAAGPDHRTSFQFRAGDLVAGKSLSGAELVFLHDWSISRAPIKQVDHQSHTVWLAQPIGASGADFFRIDGFEPHPRYFVEDAAELLDAPGEWYLDTQQGLLTYQATAGDVPDQTTIVAPVLSQLLVVRGDLQNQQPVRNLHFVGLSLAHAAAPRLPAGYAGIQAGFHEQRAGDASSGTRGRMPAAIVWQAAEGCRLENCRLRHTGGTGISLEGGCRRNELVGNEIADVGGNGVMVGEPGQQLQDMAAENVVANNHVHHCGLRYFGCVGVWVGITDGTRVAHNEIHDLPYSGVSVGWVWNTTPSPCRANKIEHNHIHHVMQVLSDGGGVYTLGRQPDTVLRGNLIHDVLPNAGRAESNGFFIDEGSSELLLEHNTIYGIARSPIRFHRAERDTIRGNTLVAAAGVPVFQYNATDEKTMTFEGNQTPAPDGWSPPSAEQLGAGLQPPYRERLLGK